MKSGATTATEPHSLARQPFHTKMSNLEVQSTFNSSLWGLPGLDKDTFYAAALYLHAARGELEAEPLFHPVATPEATRFFLDRFADCFARSKLADARDHVSATAMVRNEKDKVITLYIAKNQSEKGYQPLASQEKLGDIANENEVYAKQLVNWFSKVASKDDILPVDLDAHSEIFKTMCRFSSSRLEHYISTISESDVDLLEKNVSLHLPSCCDGWEMTKFLINECKLYDMRSQLPRSGSERICLLTTYAYLAGQIRNYPGFRSLTEKTETSTSRHQIENVAQVVKWINHLGRLLAAFTSFQRFCRDKKQSGFSFKHRLLRSEEDDLDGHMYKKKLYSWTGDLGLTRERQFRRVMNGRTVLQDRSVEALMNEVVETTGTKARVHCEMQLLIHFSKPGREKCLDYFGCSKKSCWLCWQMISQNHKYSMKNTHRKLYPRWAFPFDFSPSQPGIAKGLRAAYNEMLTVIQDQIISPRPPSTLEPYPQTSARMTPAHQRRRTGEDLDHGLLSRWSSSNIVTVPERFPAVRVPALYLPADGESLENLRQVSVDAYAKDSSDAAEICLLGFENFAGKDIIFAFQLHTKPKSSSDAVEVRKSMWRKLLFDDADDLYKTFKLYYRACGDGLAPNSYMVSIWRKVYGEEPQFFPWKGDIFVILCRNTKSNDLLRRDEVVPEPFTLDHSKVLTTIERLFSHKKQEWNGEYAKIESERNASYVSKGCKDFSEWIMNQRNHEELMTRFDM